MAGIFLVWLAVLVILADFKARIIPDCLVFIGLWAGLVASLHHLWLGPEQCVYGVIFAYGIWWAWNKVVSTFGAGDLIFHGVFFI